MDRHTFMCDFFQMEKADDCRDKSEDFFKIFQNLFKQMESNLPKPDRKKGPAKNNQADLIAELKKKQGGMK